jgi:hypothetical protein
MAGIVTSGNLSFDSACFYITPAIGEDDSEAFRFISRLNFEPAI